MTDRTTKLTIAAKATGAGDVKKLGRTIGELGKIDTFRKLAKDAKASLNTWKTAQAEVQRLANEYKKAEKPSAALRKEFERAQRSAGNLKKAYTDNRTRLAALRKELHATGVNTAKLNTENKRLRESYRQTKVAAAQALKLDTSRGLLNVAPYRNVKREVQRLQGAYNRLARSGTLSSNELAEAQRNLKNKVRELRNETSGLADGMRRAQYGMIGVAAGFYAAMRSITGAVGVLKDAETSTFMLESSVAAANREFENVGSVTSWSNTVKDLAKELKVYSESALKQAVSRTVDMTKRLGLSEDQMAEVIRRSAQLSAGKVELVGGIERVTAALRGEAESAEYLGLTLNENYVKAWYAARGATQGAWKDLTDYQKAQVRLAAFLEQTNGIVDRTSEYATTLAGAWVEVRANIDNAIANNPAIVSSMKDLAQVLLANADTLTGLVASVTSYVANVIEWAVENKELVAIMAGGLVTLKLWRAGVGDIVLGLAGMVRGAQGAKIAVANLAGPVASLTAAGRGFLMANPVAAITAAIGTAAAVGAGRLAGYTVGMKAANEATQRLFETTGRVQLQFAEFANIKIKTNLADEPLEDLKTYQTELLKAKVATLALVNELTARAEQETFFGRQTEDAKLAAGQLEKVRERYDDLNAALVEIARLLEAGTDVTKKAVDEEAALTDALEKTAAALKDVAKEAEKAYRERAQVYSADTALRKAELDKQLAEIELAVEKEKMTHAEAAVKKIELEKAFTEAKIEQIDIQLKQVKAIYGEESAEYKNLLAAKIAATTELTGKESALEKAKRALTEATLEQYQATILAAGAIKDEAKELDKDTEAILRNLAAKKANADAPDAGSGGGGSSGSGGGGNDSDSDYHRLSAKKWGDLTLDQLLGRGEISSTDYYKFLKHVAAQRSGAAQKQNEMVDEYKALANETQRWGVHLNTSTVTLGQLREIVKELREQYAAMRAEAEKMTAAEREAFISRRRREIADGLRKKYATGGRVYGPSHRRGGVLAELEGNEWIHPVRSVKKYGAGFMSAVQRGLLDSAAIRALMAGKFNIPKFEMGGPVAAAAGGPMVSDVVELRLSMGGDRAVMRGDRANTEGVLDILRQFQQTSRG